jgi:hypothetical protein
MLGWLEKRLDDQCLCKAGNIESNLRVQYGYWPTGFGQTSFKRK